jgi:hypothetical protein
MTRKEVAMAEELKNENTQVESGVAPKDAQPEAQSKDEQGANTAYEKKALDTAGRDWSKRKTFKPKGTV